MADIVGVKVILDDGSEIEPSCWSVAYLYRDKDGKPWTQFSWTRKAHSAEELVVLGIAIKSLHAGYNEDPAIQGVLPLLELDGLTVEQFREVSRNLLRDLEKNYKSKTDYKAIVSELRSELKKSIEENIVTINEFIHFLEKAESLYDLLKELQKHNIPVDQHWIRASIALSLMELEIRKKLTVLKVTLPYHETLEQLIVLVRKKIKESEGREIKKTVITLDDLRKWRNIMFHQGLDISVPKEQADLIVNAVASFITELFPINQAKI